MDFTIVTVCCAAEGCDTLFKIDGSDWSDDYVVYCHQHSFLTDADSG